MCVCLCVCFVLCCFVLFCLPGSSKLPFQPPIRGHLTQKGPLPPQRGHFEEPGGLVLFGLFVCLIDCLFVCLFGWLVGWLVVWLFGCLVVWLFGCLVLWFFGCSFRTAVGAHGGERKTACQGAFMFFSLTVGSVSSRYVPVS